MGKPYLFPPLASLLLLLLLSAPGARASGVDPFPQAAAAYLIQAGGTTVWTHQADRRLPPASLTKVMTALIVLERGRLDETVTVSRTAAAETGHQLHLRAGEKWRAEDLLAATLIESANDACRALAEHIAGSQERFVALMNARAARLGLQDTHFMNVAGHDHPQHYSTAADLALLAEAALAHPLFRDLVATESLTIRPLNSQRLYRMQNSNKLLGRYPGMVGVKTGYTPGAGRCLIALVERDGVEVLVVLLRAPNRWNTAEKMLDHTFQLVAGSAEQSGSPVAMLGPEPEHQRH
jgi:D-alanyl-D-alanine carboxypeptidase (penicillin-binding protein 5/6)